MRCGLAVRRPQNDLDRLPYGLEWLKVGAAVSTWHGVCHISHALGGLAERDDRDDFVLQRIYCSGRTRVLDPNIDPLTITRGPQAMRQVSSWNLGDLGEVVG